MLPKCQALSRCFRHEIIRASETLSDGRWLVVLVPFIGQETVLENLNSMPLPVQLRSGRGRFQV